MVLGKHDHVVVDHAHALHDRLRRQRGEQPRARRLDLHEAEVPEPLHQASRASSPLATQWWGDRTFTIQDLYGYQLWFYQPVAEPKPPQGAKII